jgi:hypothetical protein
MIPESTLSLDAGMAAVHALSLRTRRADIIFDSASGSYPRDIVEQEKNSGREG